MLSNNAHIPRLGPLNLRTKQCQPLSDVYHLTHDPCLSTRRHWAQIGHFEVAAHTAEGEIARLREPQEDCSGENINQRCSATAVQVTHVVAESRGDVDEEGDLGRRAAGRGLKAQVALARIDVPVLENSQQFAL